VQGLGDLFELEVVLGPGQSTQQSEEEGKSIAAELLRKFGIGPEDLIAEAYVDLPAGAQAWHNAMPEIG
jgi:adenylate cyclase class IV